MKNIFKLILASSLIHQFAIAQTESSFQDSARPFGLDIVGPVMEAGQLVLF